MLMNLYNKLDTELAFWKHFRPVRYNLIGAALIILAVVAGAFAVAGMELYRWNDGTCDKCGGHYEFVQAYGAARTSKYLYRCDECGRMNEFSINMEAEY